MPLVAGFRKPEALYCLRSLEPLVLRRVDAGEARRNNVPRRVYIHSCAAHTRKTARLGRHQEQVSAEAQIHFEVIETHLKYAATAE
jgi:hypothetical protein